ncbi:hypothetical protein ACOSQ4_031554 [Xanthoceras sorbifolium]
MVSTFQTEVSHSSYFAFNFARAKLSSVQRLAFLFPMAITFIADYESDLSFKASVALGILNAPDIRASAKRCSSSERMTSVRHTQFNPSIDLARLVEAARLSKNKIR